jgi:hypothetical protein
LNVYKAKDYPQKNRRSRGKNRRRFFAKGRWELPDLENGQKRAKEKMVEKKEEGDGYDGVVRKKRIIHFFKMA